MAAAEAMAAVKAPVAVVARVGRAGSAHALGRGVLLCLLMAIFLTATARAENYGVDKVPTSYRFEDPRADHTAAGIAFDEAKRRNLAVQAFEAAVRFNPTSATYNNLGVVLMREHQYERSREALLQALKIEPNNKHAMDNMKDLNKLAGDYLGSALPPSPPSPLRPPPAPSNEYEELDDLAGTGLGHAQQTILTYEDDEALDLDDYEPDDYAEGEATAAPTGSRPPSTAHPSPTPSAAVHKPAAPAPRPSAPASTGSGTLKPPQNPGTLHLPPSNNMTGPRWHFKRPLRAGGSLKTVPLDQAWRLAEEADAPSVPIRSQNMVFDNAPPKTVAVKGRQDLLRFIRNEFRERYFEQFPVYIQAQGAYLDFLNYSAALSGQTFNYAGDKEKSDPRNVKFIKRTFDQKQESGRKTEKDLARALREGFTLQFYSVNYWDPNIASLALELSEHGILLPVNANLYITPGGTSVSLVPHTDYQCSLMVQLAGVKRWRLWKMPEIMLPVSANMIRGRDTDDLVASEELGEPYMDVLLQPGDILYVPRGVLHATSTPEGDHPSMHLTVGMEAMWDLGIGQVWHHFLGAGAVAHHQHIVEGLYTALRRKTHEDARYRATMPASFYNRSGDPKQSAEWREMGRQMLHDMVDELVDHTLTFERIQKLMLGQVRKSRDRLVREFKAQRDLTFQRDSIDATAHENANREWYLQWQRKHAAGRHDEL
ncbi:uncharacterized protein MONBRDRAFT_31896 [Monosiga brevicollis MX1]|uniref:Bifunctional lysine-specific demethylase and histidyl-hydroxylase n=1 Tax=Monosiga brevicollis TaxID=81824 RepID=A9UW44_MONBE|nr:uncharacterized protein MONBRDRAFT_31896 [Monosiga brevicollis MX1]EDQ90497.1 predicted protein [Monosiga brevicollis MX1]|eukprot:XP_001744548.1 hypothetical protein [Monosiga brevicollis MX1]